MMKQINFFLRSVAVAVVVAASACSGEPTTLTGKADSANAPAGPDTIVVNNAPEMYSTRFIDALRKSGIANKYTLEKNIIMRDDTVESYFYDYLELNKEYVLKGCADSTCYKLNVTRISNTTVRYVLEAIVGKGSPVFSLGEADLSPGFMLASENDEAEDGESYEVSEYVDLSTCNLAIRIGRTGGDNLKGRITRHCENGTAEITLENSPFLVEEGH